VAQKLAVVAPTGTALELLIDDYLASCRARGLSKSTVSKNYGYALHHVFLPWARDAGITDPEQLDQRVFDRFTASLLDDTGRAKPMSKDTVHSYVRPIRQCLGWARKQGDVRTAAQPQLPKLPRRVLDVLSRDEIARIEAAATTERDKLAIRLLADTGMRIEELCKLRIDDTSRHDRGALLKVRGKGDKERLVPLRTELARRYERFAKSRPANVRTDRLFLSHRRSADGGYRPVTGSGIRQMIDVAVDRAGITKRTYPHLFRHSFATEALRRGMSPIQLAQILGHSSLQMIDRVYSHLTATDAYDAMMRMLTDD
jgi:integrase/recombinase XerD